MAIPKLNTNAKPSVPTRAPRGNASTGVGKPAMGHTPAATRPVQRQVAPPTTNVPTRTPSGKGGTNINARPVGTSKPMRVAPGPYGQPVVSRGTVGAGTPSSVKSAPPQKKGSPQVVGGATVGKPVTGTMLKGMKKGPVLQKGAPAATRMRLGKKG